LCVVNNLDRVEFLIIQALRLELEGEHFEYNKRQYRRDRAFSLKDGELFEIDAA